MCTVGTSIIDKYKQTLCSLYMHVIYIYIYIYNKNIVTKKLLIK